MKSTERLLTEADKIQITKAIETAEKQCSGEIRVHLISHSKGDILDQAAFVFNKLGMHKTEKRNGVLFLLATTDKKFAVLGDAGINTIVPSDFWNIIKEEMQNHFREGNFVTGLEVGIKMAGEALNKYFPYCKDDKDELSNAITFD
jgi:uncharacterized membrane protein